MSAATMASPANKPLSHECRQVLTVANDRVKKIRKACGVAAFNGWTTAIFAAASAPFAPFSIAGFLVTAGLTVVAYNEFRGRKQLQQFKSSAASFLGWNQVGFLLLIIFYSVWMICSGLASEGPFAAELAANPELANALGPMEQFDGLYKFLVIGVYGTVIALSTIFQGLNAVYYFTRRKHVETYVQETPEWVLDVQRMTHA